MTFEQRCESKPTNIIFDRYIYAMAPRISAQRRHLLLRWHHQLQDCQSKYLDVSFRTKKHTHMHKTKQNVMKFTNNKQSCMPSAILKAGNETGTWNENIHTSIITILGANSKCLKDQTIDAFSILPCLDVITSKVKYIFLLSTAIVGHI